MEDTSSSTSFMYHRNYFAYKFGFGAKVNSKEQFCQSSFSYCSEFTEDFRDDSYYDYCDSSREVGSMARVELAVIIITDSTN